MSGKLEREKAVAPQPKPRQRLRPERMKRFNGFIFLLLSLERTVEGWLAASWRSLSTWVVQWPLGVTCVFNKSTLSLRTLMTPVCEYTAYRSKPASDWLIANVSKATILDTWKQVVSHSTGCFFSWEGSFDRKFSKRCLLFSLKLLLLQNLK